MAHISWAHRKTRLNLLWSDREEKPIHEVTLNANSQIITKTKRDSLMSQKPQPELSVVVPCHDEQENVVKLIEELRSALGGFCAYEMIFVDDGSKDTTLDRLKSARNDSGDLRIIHHETACGQSAALRTGFRHAYAPLIATLDGDGQNDPADLPRLLEAYRAPDADPLLRLVAGQRVNRKDTGSKRIQSKIANKVRCAILRDDTPDTGCGTKLMDRDIALTIPFFNHFHRYFPALFQREGYKIVSVPVNHRPRGGGRSKYTMLNRLFVGLRDLAGVRWLIARMKLPIVSGIEE